ncbi:hypothetical protein CAB1_0072 [Chlamydia abortus LLG]|uniref:hypothetical protein n=1 Tax=Chlamydia abortus TaxID=83555 RepID=UPI00029CC9B2|nr:hypothetical protein [Chlamydia abortus]EGK68848.1 hypothetical protein CAB1_0072 [Chlamydia abortus LLG]SFV98638.1 Uncharacterised protein [Chlamydia abortus]
MYTYLVCGLLAFIFLPRVGAAEENAEIPVPTTLCISKNEARESSSWYFWKDPKVVREKQHMHFLKQVILALKRPEIWNDPLNLLHILLQFDKFPEASGECHDLLLVVIKHRVMLLTMNAG